MSKNRDWLIGAERELFTRVELTPIITAINLGCGSRILAGFKNVDKFYDHPDVIKNDITTLESFEPNSVDLLFSAHSLEHVSLRHVPKTLRRWVEVLKPGGELWISMPDLDTICRQLIETTDSKLREWLKYTIYGWQAPQGCAGDYEGPVDPGQFHTSGYGQVEFIGMLGPLGIKITSHFSYDGYGTPSFQIIGEKL